MIPSEWMKGLTQCNQFIDFKINCIYRVNNNNIQNRMSLVGHSQLDEHR